MFVSLTVWCTHLDPHQGELHTLRNYPCRTFLHAFIFLSPQQASYNMARSTAALPLLFLLVGLAAVNGMLESVAKGLNSHRFLQSESDCPTEYIACQDEPACMACDAVFFDRFTDCTGGDDIFECDKAQETACCSLATQDEGCEHNEAFVAYVGGCAHVENVDEYDGKPPRRPPSVLIRSGSVYKVRRIRKLYSISSSSIGGGLMRSEKFGSALSCI